jgi:hypothetical protein
MLKWFRGKRREPNTKPKKELQIIGVTLGWDLKPHLCFKGGKILWGNADRILYPEYFIEGEFPVDPVTKEKLIIVRI